MADAKIAGDPNLNFDDLFTDDKQPGGNAAPAAQENLEELEAFLDQFEKQTDPAATPAPSSAPAAATPSAASAASFDATDTEQLVHGLLKDDELNLDVQGEAPGSGEPAGEAIVLSDPHAEDIPEFEPQPLKAAPLDVPAFINAAPAAARPVPAGAAGFSRVGFILALVLGGAALLVAIAAGWMAVNANQAARAVESRLAETPPGQDPRVTALQGDVSALRKQVEDMSKSIAPLSAYQKDLETLQDRVGTLEKADAAPAAANVVLAPTVTPVAPAETAKMETAQPAAPPPVPAAKAEPATPTPLPDVVPAEPPKSAPVAKRAPKKSAAKRSGPWVVYLTSSDEARLAKAQLAHARAAGLPAQLVTAEVQGSTWHRVMVPGFASADEARRYAATEAATAGFHVAWIGKAER